MMNRGWPSKGSITYKAVTASYRPGLPPVLRDLSFHVEVSPAVHITVLSPEEPPLSSGAYCISTIAMLTSLLSNPLQPRMCTMITLRPGWSTKIHFDWADRIDCASLNFDYAKVVVT